MTDIQHKSGKTDKQFLFEVQLKRVEKNCGELHAGDVSGTIHVATPLAFGGEGNDWSPEHLFLGSVNSCYMTTYLSFAKRLGFEITHFDCQAIGQIELVEGKYKFTHINLYPKICIAEELLRSKAGVAMEKTQKYCLVGNSIDVPIIYHGEILIKTFRGKEIKEGTVFKR